MSESYERERQNNARLGELSAKVSALRGVTIDIYDNARAQDVIDNTVRFPPILEPINRRQRSQEGKEEEKANPVVSQRHSRP